MSVDRAPTTLPFRLPPHPNDPTSPAIARARAHLARATQRETGIRRRTALEYATLRDDEVLGQVVYTGLAIPLRLPEQHALTTLLADTAAAGQVWSPGLDWVARAYERSAEPPPSILRERIDRMGEWAFASATAEAFATVLATFRSRRLRAEVVRWVSLATATPSEVCALADAVDVLALWNNRSLTDRARDALFAHVAGPLTTGEPQVREMPGDRLLEELARAIPGEMPFPCIDAVTAVADALVAQAAPRLASMSPSDTRHQLQRRVSLVCALPGLRADTIRALVATVGPDPAEPYAHTQLLTHVLRQPTVPADVVETLLADGPVAEAVAHAIVERNDYLLGTPGIRAKLLRAHRVPAVRRAVVRMTPLDELSDVLHALIDLDARAVATCVHEGLIPAGYVLPADDLHRLLAHPTGDVRTAGLLLAAAAGTDAATQASPTRPWLHRHPRR